MEHEPFITFAGSKAVKGKRSMDEFRRPSPYDHSRQLFRTSKGSSDDGVVWHAKYSGIGLQLRKLIRSDSRQEFASFLNSQYQLRVNGVEHYIECFKSQMWESICSHRAFGCASALINGETEMLVDLNERLGSGLLDECEGPADEGLTPLAYAAQNLSYDFTVLLLKHGADPNLEGSRRPALSSHPLALALDALCNQQLVRDFLAGEGSIYDLLSLFWLPELNEPLDTIKLLAARTRQLEWLGVCYVEGCSLVKLAALLMFAWDKVVIDNDINSSSIWQLARIQHDRESDLERKEILRSMWRVIRLLERSRSFVEEYRTSKFKHEAVPPEVAYKFLTEVELHVEEKHVSFPDLDRFQTEPLLGDEVMLERALLKMCLKEMITKPIYFIPKSPETDVAQIRRSSFYSHIECAMRLDDAEEFVKVMHGVDSFGYLDCKNKLAETVRTFMFAFDSANCAAAILAGETDDILSFSELTDVGWSFLHKAVKLETPKLTALLLEHGFSADDRRDCDELNLQAALPLNVALENIRDHYLLRDWKDSKSAIDLVVLLCDNKLRNILETVRLLVLKTTNVYFEFLRYLKEGKMVEFCALLMVGCKEFLPSAFVVQSLVSTSLAHNATVAHPVRDFSTSSLHTNLHENNDPLEGKGTLILIDTFKKIGDRLGAYVRLEQIKSRDQIVLDITWLLARAGISDMQVSPIHDTPSRGLYSADHDRVLGQEYQSIIEQRSGHKLLSGNMFLKQAAPNKFSKKGTLFTAFPRSLHTSALTIDADSCSSIPPKHLIVLQRLHSPMRCVSIMAALRKGVRFM